MLTARPSRATGSILPVGRWVFVHCPTNPGKAVELTDDAGCGSGAMLTDGTEVEIVAWRPRGASGTRYRVQGKDHGVQGWLGGDNLRAPVPVTPPKSPVAAAPVAAKKAIPAKPGGRVSAFR
jgi:hypothetical protein